MDHMKNLRISILGSVLGSLIWFIDGFWSGITAAAVLLLWNLAWCYGVDFYFYRHHYDH